MEQKITEKSEPRVRFTLWMKKSTDELVDMVQDNDNCGTKSEFIEKAILFYCGYLQSEKNQNYLPNIVVSTLKSIIRDTESRQNRNLFKMAVELNVLTRVLATLRGIGDRDYEDIRVQAKRDAKNCNGIINIEDIING